MAQNASVFRQMGLGRTFKKECDAALAIDPNHVEALKNIMQFYLHAPGVIGGDRTKAHGIADQLMKLDPVEGYQAHVMVGGYLGGVKLKRYEEAERHAREAIRIHPDRAGAHSLLAAVLVREDKWPDLDAALAQAEKDDPDNLYPLFRAANNLLDRKVDLPRAERYFRKYLTLEPEAHMPNFAAAHWRLGLVLEQEGRKPDAIAEWQTAVKLDPNSQAKQDLKRVK